MAPTAIDVAAGAAPQPAPPRSAIARLPDGWPLAGLLGLYPLWWALGVGALAFLLFAVPMAWHLARHRPLRVPRGFGLWLLFLVWTLASLSMLAVDPIGTRPGGPAGRALGVGANLAGYFAATIVLLYVVNLPHAQMSQRRLLRLLSVLFVVTVAGGLLGVVVPRFEFVAPLEHLLPEGIRSNDYAEALVHPAASQIQDVLGYDAARPAAPFGYTNFWGNNLSILLVWFVAYAWTTGSGARRLLPMVVPLVAVIPVVHSLNRALWAGLILSAIYAVARLVLRGRFAGLVVAAALAPAAVVAFTLTPLNGVVQERLSHSGSSGLRGFLTEAAVDGAARSPVIGYGGTRKTLGSQNSISVGPTADCPDCGEFNIGSNGQFWLVLFAQGFVGAALFVGFFLSVAVAFWREPGITAAAGVLVALLAVFYSMFYSAFPGALTLTMISIGVMVRDRGPEASASRAALPLGEARRPSVAVGV